MPAFKRSYLTLLVLQLLHEEEMYGYHICQVIKQRTDGRYELKEGTIYPLLHELEKNEVVKGEWRMSPQGPQRKYFQLTSKGRKLLEHEKQTLEEFVGLIFMPNITPARP